MHINVNEVLETAASGRFETLAPASKYNILTSGLGCIRNISFADVKGFLNGNNWPAPGIHGRPSQILFWPANH